MCDQYLLWFYYDLDYKSVNTICISAICELPHIDNGAFSGSGCAEGATILVDVECEVDCDDNHMESVPTVTCEGAGNLSEDAPICQGTMVLNTYVEYKLQL